MRYWFDTEFIEDGRTIDLLSIGVVAEDGREFYLESAETQWSKANDWVKANVLTYLRREGETPHTHAMIATLLQEFCDPEKYGKPEFWAYYADYDWVVLCQLFGRMIDLPKGWPMYCLDIKQWAYQLGDPKLPKDPEQEHHALADARWNREAWEFLWDRANEEGMLLRHAR